MEKEQKHVPKFLEVQGSLNYRRPKEITDFFAGKGLSLDFLRKYDGFGKGITIEPRLSANRTDLPGHDGR